jgi:hypothetical protein
VNREQEQNGSIAANSQPQIQSRVANGRVTWTGPLLLVTGRNALMFAAQAFVAVIFALQGSPTPWRSAAPWWTVYGTLVDLGCLALMWRFTRAEGITLRDLIGPIHWPGGRDLWMGIGFYLLVFPLFLGGGLLSAVLLYGSPQADPYPGLVFGRILPAWAVVYSRSLWWLIWSPTEEMTYQAYALPRIQALSGRASVAVVVVSFWWALQHSFLPFIPDWRDVIWRFLAFVPGVIGLILVYLRTRRLAPLIVAHWLMDITAAVMTIKL